MSYTISPLEVQSPFGITFQQQFFQQPGADRLMILLPGRGYTVDNPALFHMLYLGLEQGYDVLPVQYGFQVQHSDLMPEHISHLMQDINAAVEQLNMEQYRAVCVVGKSLGTPLAVTLAQELNIAEKALILLTPIGASPKEAEGIPTLAVIGTADRLYTEGMSTPAGSVRWHIIPDVNHALLKEDDWRYSVKCLYDMLEQCAAFLQESLPR